MTLLRIAAVIAALAAAAAAGPAAAQQAAPAASRIGYVNTQRVLRDSRASQQVQKTLDAEIQKREREIDAGPKEQIERRRIALAEDIGKRRDDAAKQFIEKADGVIKRIAEAEKIDIVFFNAAYANARVDITDKVIKALDAGR